MKEAGTALKLLRIAKSIDHQFWWFQSPLRHFETEVGVNVIQGMESRRGQRVGYDAFELTLSLLDMTAEEVGQLCGSKKQVGEKVQRLIRMLPKPSIDYRVMPVTAHVLRFHVRIYPEFEWNGRWHGNALTFWLWVEDTQSDRM